MSGTSTRPSRSGPGPPVHSPTSTRKTETSRTNTTPTPPAGRMRRRRQRESVSDVVRSVGSSHLTPLWVDDGSLGRGTGRGREGAPGGSGGLPGTRWIWSRPVPETNWYCGAFLTRNLQSKRDLQVVGVLLFYFTPKYLLRIITFPSSSLVTRPFCLRSRFSQVSWTCVFLTGTRVHIPVST